MSSVSKVDWRYHRAGCTSCGRTQTFLDSHEIATVEQVNAKKTVLKGPEALALARSVKQLYVTRGKKVVHFDMKRDAPDDETLLNLMLGPVGNLRAPTVRRGNTLIVGFDADTYTEILGS